MHSLYENLLLGLNFFSQPSFVEPNKEDTMLEIRVVLIVVLFEPAVNCGLEHSLFN